jgi:hypothetical protein
MTDFVPLPNERFGSKGDTPATFGHVRSTPETGRRIFYEYTPIRRPSPRDRWSSLRRVRTHTIGPSDRRPLGRFVQQSAKVDEMGMRRRSLLEFGGLLFGDELLGVHKRTSSGASPVVREHSGEER